jgi:hypothetical protein
MILKLEKYGKSYPIELLIFFSFFVRQWYQIFLKTEQNFYLRNSKMVLSH